MLWIIAILLFILVLANPTARGLLVVILIGGFFLGAGLLILGVIALALIFLFT